MVFFGGTTDIIGIQILNSGHFLQMQQTAFKGHQESMEGERSQAGGCHHQWESRGSINCKSERVVGGRRQVESMNCQLEKWRVGGERSESSMDNRKTLGVGVGRSKALIAYRAM